MRGMNLGGWLVMEQWMTPQLYNGVPDMIDGWNIQLEASNNNWLSANNPRTVRIRNLEGLIEVKHWCIGTSMLCDASRQPQQQLALRNQLGFRVLEVRV